MIGCGQKTNAIDVWSDVTQISYVSWWKLQMVEYFNQKANLSGDFPLGSFNAAFNFTGLKHIDAVSTKTLSMDGYYIPLAKLQLLDSPLVLQQNVKQAVPTNWDPASLARYGCQNTRWK